MENRSYKILIKQVIYVSGDVPGEHGVAEENGWKAHMSCVIVISLKKKKGKWLIMYFLKEYFRCFL